MKTTTQKKTRFVALIREDAHGRHEVHQQEYGNRNFITVTRRKDRETGELLPPTLNDGGKVFTVYTKDEHCGRGDYADELDIELDRNGRRRGSRAQVKRIADVVLAAEYEKGLRVSRIVERFGIFF